MKMLQVKKAKGVYYTTLLHLDPYFSLQVDSFSELLDSLSRFEVVKHDCINVGIKHMTVSIIFFLILKSNFHSDSKFQFSGLFRIKSFARQDRACNFRVSINVVFVCVFDSCVCVVLLVFFSFLSLPLKKKIKLLFLFGRDNSIFSEKNAASELYSTIFIFTVFSVVVFGRK